VFFGSTNALEYLKDETGGRRFWPIRCGKIRPSAIVRDRDQLWAEAVALYNAGEPWWLTDEALLVQAREQQEHRYQEDPWQEFIANYCAAADDVLVAEILEALGVEGERWGQVEQNRVARCLAKLGWERYQKRLSSEVRQWRYRRAGVTSHN
jgi:predicted P-loop ATPase